MQSPPSLWQWEVAGDCARKLCFGHVLLWFMSVCKICLWFCLGLSICLSASSKTIGSFYMSQLMLVEFFFLCCFARLVPSFLFLFCVVSKTWVAEQREKRSKKDHPNHDLHPSSRQHALKWDEIHLLKLPSGSCFFCYSLSHHIHDICQCCLLPLAAPTTPFPLAAPLGCSPHPWLLLGAPNPIE